MRRLLDAVFPAPLMSVALFAFWLVLNRSLGPGHLLLAVLVALGLPIVLAPLCPRGVRIRHPLVVARLVLSVGRDVLVSNFDVAWGVLHARRRPLRPAFVVLPLTLRDPYGLAALATITAVVPGTVWNELAPDRSALRLHAFDVEDEAAFIADFKERYERPLIQIFQSAGEAPR